jgi:hypothetical protein
MADILSEGEIIEEAYYRALAIHLGRVDEFDQAKAGGEADD